MLIPEVRFPIVVGRVLTHLRTELAAWSGLTVQAKVPDPMPQRLVTVRDDGGTDDGLKVLTRFGVNVWADSSTDAENIARDAMAALRTLPGTGPFKATSGFTGPVEIDDDPAYTFGNASMTHYFFSFSAVVKGT